MLCDISSQAPTLSYVCVKQKVQNVLIVLFSEVTLSYKVDLPLCCYGSCCWQENRLWFGSYSVKMV